MKLRNIFIAGMSAVALASCSDYLEVDAPSKNQPTDVFSDARAMERARNGIYATMLSSNLWGDKLINTFVRNNDVEFTSNSSQYTTSNKYCRFDCDPTGGDIKSTWTDLYHAIEVCNLFIEGAEGSPAYDAENPDADIIQMIGEAKVARAMLYHELIWNWGDVPFSFNSSQTTKTMIYPVTDRQVILDKLLDDVKGVADKMMDPAKISEGVERISRQAAYAMVARLAMTAGGYRLVPDGDTYGKMVQPANWRDYYTTAVEYGLKVKESNCHFLNKEYHKVFVDECNNLVANNDDPIFEIPFGKESTGNIGYIHGPRMDTYEGVSPHPYGKASSAARLNALYRFSFDPDDVRRDYVNQMFRYTADGGEFATRLENSYTLMNGKWSKLWVTGGLGKATEGNTGINFPYLRYADVLLTIAEAEAVLNDGPTPLAQECLEAVRTRAFAKTNPAKITDYPADGENFLKAVLNERKWELAGENLRWRDLVRNNMLALEAYWTFYRYLSFAEESDGSSTYLNEVAAHDSYGDETFYDNVPFTIATLRTADNLDPNTKEVLMNERQFPNQEMKICWMLNPYESKSTAELNALKGQYTKIASSKWTNEEMYSWWDTDNGIAKNEVRYSMLGYIYMNELGTVRLIDNGVEKTPVEPSATLTAADLPVVRYILPYPATEIARAQGQYVNKYGYSQQ